ncbi:hypothetical protein A5881_001865 [Enterococcus termitis]|nr:hypothetical protein A5881_001814 [Enterococcus termitis]
MEEYPVRYEDPCPVTTALKIIGGKWRIPIIWKLAKGPVRYNELKRQLTGITNIMLTRSLRELEENYLLKRVQYSNIPPHVEYSLTENGLKLLPALMIIKDWGLEVINKGTK